MKRTRVSLLLLLLLAAAPPVVWANTGLPMLIVAWPVLGIALIPVVVLESALLSRSLNQSFDSAFAPVFEANLWSTLAGVPITWAALLAVELVVGVSLNALPDSIANSRAVRIAAFPFMAAWILPSSGLEIKAAFVVLMFAFCVASAEVEHLVLVRRLPGISRSLRRIVYTFNAASYALLTAFVVIAYSLALGSS